MGECQCTWGPVEGLEEDMQALNSEDNILGEDYTEWSEHDDPEELYSVYGDWKEEEMTDTSSDDMPSLIDVADDSDHDQSEVPVLSNNVMIFLPAYPAYTTLAIQYLDDVIQSDTMDMDNTTMGIICMN